MGIENIFISVSEGGMELSIEVLVEGEGKSFFAFGAEKLVSILCDGTQKKLDKILTKLDEIQAALRRLPVQIVGALQEGQLKEVEASIKSWLLLCKQKTATGEMTIDDARPLMEKATYLEGIMTGKAGVEISACYLETARQHSLRNSAGTNIFQFWDTFQALISYYGSMIMAAYSALNDFEEFQTEVGKSLQRFLERSAEILGPIPLVEGDLNRSKVNVNQSIMKLIDKHILFKIMRNVYGNEGGKKSVIFRNKQSGADLMVSGNNRWFLHKSGGSIWFRFENQQDRSGIDHYYGREIRRGEPGAWHNNHMWTLIPVTVEDPGDGKGPSTYYFNIRNDATGQCLDHYYGRMDHGRPVLSTAGTPSWHINHIWRAEEWE
eukprot:gene19120-21037_t